MSLTCGEREKCGSIIHLASGTAALIGSGMAQIPLSDAILLAPIQTKMLTAIGTVFDINLTESAAKGLCAALTACCIGRSVSQILVGWIPGVGNLVNASTAAGITEAMGWLAVEHFQAERDGTSFKEAANNFFVPVSKTRRKLNRFMRKAKIFCEECLENLEKQFES